MVIGAGFAGMAAASVLAQHNFTVTLLEKNDQPGGRCRTWKNKGFTFDMGPSWYWMPDVFERFYNRFGHTTEDFYKLIRLDPSYKVFFKDTAADIPADFYAFCELLESWEIGADEKVEKFLADAQYKYEVGMRDLVYKPGFSVLEFADLRLVKSLFQMNLFSSLQQEVRHLFKHPNIRQLLEFPVLFLGAKPADTPALYSLMNYADVKLGTWYPNGGMHEIALAFENIALSQGVEMKYNEAVTGFQLNNGSVNGVKTDKQFYNDVDLVISGADYHHTEQLLPQSVQSYSADYWDSRKLSPSCLLFFVGLREKVDGLRHHNLFFDADFEQHGKEIYDDPQWPRDPLFYACVPSKTDQSVAPEGCENLFLLLPVAPDLAENKHTHHEYFNQMITRLEQKTKKNIRSTIIFKRSFGVNDFKLTYNALKGNAYGLANTLKQTAILKPKMKSKHLSNLFYCGQLTVPGPGVPPSIISGQIIADYLIKKYN